MSISRCKTLLSSSDNTDQRNGCALLINAAATSANVPDILSEGIIGLLLPKLRDSNSDLVMKACWAINNLCVHGNPPLNEFLSICSVGWSVLTD